MNRPTSKYDKGQADLFLPVFFWPKSVIRKNQKPKADTTY